MTLAKAIDIGLGLLLVSLAVGLAASGVTELIAKIVGKRSKDLWSAIQTLLDAEPQTSGTDQRPGPKAPEDDASTTFTRRLYGSPFINELGRVSSSGRTLIDDVGSNDFARGVVSLAADEAAGDNPIARLINTLPADAPVTNALRELAVEADHDVSKVVQGLSSWFDEQMSRLSKVYRRWSRLIALFVGIAIALCANVDMLFVARALNASDALRTAADSTATQLVQQCKDKTGDDFTKCANDALSSLESGSNAVDLPVGWANKANRNFDGWNLLWKVLGWGITAVAAMQGGPFWFDLLRRLIGLRSGASPGAAPAAAPA